MTIDDTFKATALANDSEQEREATITFSADGCDDVVVVTVSQEGKPAEGATISATLSFADKAHRTKYSNEQQIWVQNGITFTNNKGKSTNNLGDYYNPVRLYKDSEVVIAAPGYSDTTQIVFDCDSGKNGEYVTNLFNSIKIGEVSQSGDKVTVTFSGLSNTGTYIIESLSGQVRLDSLTIYYL